MSLKKSKKKINKRPTLTEENNSLKETIKAIQDQNTALTEANHVLDKENSILRERLSNFGLRDLCKNAGWAGIGIAAGVGFTGNPSAGLKIAIISSILVSIFSIYDNFWVKSKNQGERV